MTLFRTSILAGISTAIKVIVGLLINKLVASSFGPTGIAFLGQFETFFMIISKLSNVGFDNGIISLASKHNKQIILYISMFWTILFSLLISAVCLYFNTNLSYFLFGTEAYYKAFTFLSATVIFIGMNRVIMYYFSAIGLNRLFFKINIITSVLILVLILLFSSIYNLLGVFFGYILGQSIVIFVGVFEIIKHSEYKSVNINIKIFRSITRKLFSYTAMALISAISTPIVIILIRQEIESKLGIISLGYWQSLWRISEGYFLLIITIMTIYYLPLISNSKSNSELVGSMINFSKKFIPFITALFIVIFLLKNQITNILYTDDFNIINKYYGYQLLADFFKFLSFIVSYILIAFRLTKPFVFFQILYGFLFYFSIKFFISDSLESVYTIYLCTSIFFMLLLLIYFLFNLKKQYILRT